MAFTPRKPFPSRDTWNGLRLSIASPERILSWSHGEITKPETINYRTQRSEKHGLFDEKIFGPEKDYECYCGKYKGIRYKGIVCDKCGVEITRSIVRRERMGHIELCTPVAHIWFLRSVPSRMALVLGASAIDLEKVIYFAGYIVTTIAEDEKKRLLAELESEYKSKYKNAKDDKERDALKEKMTTAKSEIEGMVVGRVLDELEYHRFSVKYGGLFEARIGAEAIYDLFRALDLKELEKTLTARYQKAGAAEREKLAKRLSLIAGMIASGVRPEWLFLIRIPVIPPALRPMVALGGTGLLVPSRESLLKFLEVKGAEEVVDCLGADTRFKETSVLHREAMILQFVQDAPNDHTLNLGFCGSHLLFQRVAFLVVLCVFIF